MSTDAELIALVAEARKKGWTSDHERHTALMMLGGEEPVDTRVMVRDVIERLCAERDRMESVAIRLATALEAARADEREAWKLAWPLGMPVTKIKGSSWTGKIVGHYSTTLTPQGVCIESENEPGSVQIYPVSAIRNRTPSPPAEEKKT